MKSADLASEATEALQRRRGELAQGLQMAALEGLPQDEDDRREVEALDAELKRRAQGPQRPSAR